MPTRRSYGDACGIARALDVVGERWALLVVRELLLGPQRFSDLRHALPNASSNLISDRLRELEDRAVLRRRKLPPPANAWVYELTGWGRDLEPIVLALGDWGIRAPLPPAPRTLSATSALLFLRTVAHADPSAPATVCRVELDERVWTIETGAGQLRVQPGEPTRQRRRLTANRPRNACRPDRGLAHTRRRPGRRKRPRHRRHVRPASPADDVAPTRLPPLDLRPPARGWSYLTKNTVGCTTTPRCRTDQPREHATSGP